MISKSNFFKTGYVACLAALLLLSSLCVAQQLTGTLIGTALDSSGAAVPNAKVTMKNDLSGDVRTTLTNGTGYFTITAIRPGTYTVVVSAQGFKQWQQAGLVFNQGDSRSLPNITLQIGTISETVEITADELGVTGDQHNSQHNPGHGCSDCRPRRRRTDQVDAGRRCHQRTKPGQYFQ